MSHLIGIIGPSGMGKSTSIFNIKDAERNIDIKGLDPKKTVIIQSRNKLLPSVDAKEQYNKKNKNLYTVTDSSQVASTIKMIDTEPEWEGFENIVLDDFQFWMSGEFFEKIDRKDWGRFNEIAANAQQVIDISTKLVRIKYVFLLAHTNETDVFTGRQVKVKTIGSLIDRQFSPEGLMTVCLYATQVKEKNEFKYAFVTNSTPELQGIKSPVGMFPQFIPNDLGYVKDQLDKFL